MSLWLWSRTIVTARGHPRGGCFVLSSIQNQPVPLVTERPTFTSLSPCYFSTSSLLSPSYWDDDCNKPSCLIQKEQMVVGRELSSPAGARLIIVHAISTTTAATTAAPNDGGCVVSVRPSSSSTTTIDIPAVDEEQGRNLPVSQEEVSCMISVLSAASKEEEEQKEEHDDHLLLHQQQSTMEKQTTTNNGTCISTSTTMKSDHHCKEDDTLSTASSSSTECTSNNSCRFFEAPPRRLTKKTEEEQLQSMEYNVKRLNNNDVSTSTINSCQIRAMLIMKDVIFRQRSAIKHISKENSTIQRKYEFYKLQNKSLSRASKQMKREVNKVCKKNEALEHELESLRTELQLAKVETLRFLMKDKNHNSSALQHASSSSSLL